MIRPFSQVGLWHSVVVNPQRSWYCATTSLAALGIARSFSSYHQHQHSHEHHTPSQDHSHDHNTPSQDHSHSHSTSNSHTHSHGTSSILGHSHSHSSADSVFFQEKGGLRNPAIRITWAGLIVNLGMAIGKGIGGVVFHSQALLADAIHALSDLVSDFLTLATVSVATTPRSALFPNGYGKIETLGSLGVSALLLLAGLSVGWSGLVSLVQQLVGDSQIINIMTMFLGHGHSHSHSHGSDGHDHVQAVDLNAMWLALASIGVKEWLYRATMKVAKRTGSAVLVANAWHHRVDSLTSVVAVCTIGGSYFLGLSWLDALGGLAVSTVIIRAGFKNGKAAAMELADCTISVEPSIVDAHRDAVLSVLAQQVAQSNGKVSIGDFDINKISLMPSGPNFISEIQLKTSTEMPTSKSVTAALFVEKNMLETDRRLKRVIVNVIDEGTLERLKSKGGQ